mmetsp:Transcript_102868/g.142292  ORF Transcript_102868/g.142292 Transcript_102868/m.142292 type:complete len:233 (+) Transcript_102868:364-1062(+)
MWQVIDRHHAALRAQLHYAGTNTRATDAVEYALGASSAALLQVPSLPYCDVPLEQQRLRLVLDDVGQVLEELGGISAIDVAVITCHGDGHHLGHAHHSVLLEHCRRLGSGDREDSSGIRREDRDEGRDAEHTQVGDGECSGRILVGLELTLHCARDEVLPGASKRVDVRGVSVLKDRGDETTVRHSNRHRHINIGVVVDPVLHVVRVNDRVLGKGEANGLGKQSGDSDTLGL